MNLNHLTIPVANLERAIDFYQLLGLHLIVKSDDYARFECLDGSSTFSLHFSNAFQPDPSLWIYFEHERLDEKINELIEKGILMDELPKDQSWLWREARLKDPDGHQLIIYFAGKNRKNPPWRIS